MAGSRVVMRTLPSLKAWKAETARRARAVPPSSAGRRLPAIMIMSLTPDPARPDV